VLKAFNSGDDVNITVSALVMQPPQVVLTRHITNLTAAGYEIGMSRVYGGVSTDLCARDISQAADLFPQIHFVFSAETAVAIGMQVGRDTIVE
jgi:hypothetical protein